MFIDKKTRSGARGLGKTAGFILAFAAFVLVGAWIASGDAETWEAGENDEINKLMYEKRLEERLNRDVESYLGHSRFIVRVDADLIKEMRKSSEVTKGEPSPYSPEAIMPPPEEVQQEAQQQQEAAAKEQAPQETLPGLPYPEEMEKKRTASKLPQAMPIKPQQQRGEGARNAQDITSISFTPVFVLKRLAISMMVDKNLTGEQEEFIKNLVFQKVHLDLMRGDTFNLIKTSFPNMPKEAVAPAAPLPAQQAEKMQKSEAEFHLDKTAALIIAAIVFAVILLLMSFRRPRETAQLAQPKGIEKGGGIMPGSVGAMLAANESLKKLAAEEARLQNLRQELVAIGIGRPEAFNRAIKGSLGSADGVKRAAIAFKTIGMPVAKSLGRDLTPEELANIEGTARELEEASSEEAMEAMDSLLAVASEKDSADEAARKVNPFSFLENLDNSQVLYLINNYEARLKALVLSQMPASRSSKILKQMPVDQQSKIVFETIRLSELPMQSFRDVARLLAKKAMDVPSFTNVVTDGVGLMVNMLDHMDLGSQTALLGQLENQTPEAYHKIKKIYFTYNDIPKLPEDVLRDAVREMDYRIIAKALSNADQAITDAVMNALPNRLQIMTADEIKTYGNTLPFSEVEEARMMLVAKFREYIKSGRAAVPA